MRSVDQTKRVAEVGSLFRRVGRGSGEQETGDLHPPLASVVISLCEMKFG